MIDFSSSFFILWCRLFFCLTLNDFWQVWEILFSIERWFSYSILIIISQYMSSEPIIIEEPFSKSKQTQKQTLSQQKFFEVLDEIQQYDTLAYSIKSKYQEAMLSLASLKFQNPYALSVNSHKCTPSFLKISQEHKLQYGYAQFTDLVDEDQVYPDEYQQHLKIQKQCLQKETKLTKLQNQQDRQKFCENELLYRFNVVNNQKKVIATSNQFKEIIELLLNQRTLRKRLQDKIKK